MARAARDAGFEVHVAANVTNDAAAIEDEGFFLHPVPFARGKLSPVAQLKAILALRRLIRTLAPGIIHNVALQPVVFGLIAAIGSRATSVNAVTGLGFTFTAATRKAQLLRAGIGMVLRAFINRGANVALVQNEDDRALLARLGIASERIVLVPGSGVDIETLMPLPEPTGPPAIAFVGRLLTIKGIRILIDAHRLLRSQGKSTGLLIAGTPDPANPTSVSGAEIEVWSREPGITWLGFVEDIATVWVRAHIAVLPALGGEGIPKSLLEAAACGRPMIATDVPGCREVVIPGDTGLLVPPDDAVALAAAIAKLAQSPELRIRLGGGARRLAEARFSSDAVGRATVDLYRRLADKVS
jgi:glycosyltransferase involved in cell wall biosynthesis